MPEFNLTAFVVLCVLSHWLGFLVHLCFSYYDKSAVKMGYGPPTQGLSLFCLNGTLLITICGGCTDSA